VPKATIWIRKDNEKAWEAIKNKSEWVNERLTVEYQFSEQGFAKVTDDPNTVNEVKTIKKPIKWRGKLGVDTVTVYAVDSVEEGVTIPDDKDLVKLNSKKPAYTLKDKLCKTHSLPVLVGRTICGQKGCK